ncbi:MAG: hypothetical protein ACSLEL_01570, partial [Candidatus Malihini olakiniferum]
IIGGIGIRFCTDSIDVWELSRCKQNEMWVNIFLLIALGTIIFLCLKVIDVKSIISDKTYLLYATFDNINSLKARPPRYRSAVW